MQEERLRPPVALQCLASVGFRGPKGWHVATSPGRRNRGSTPHGNAAVLKSTCWERSYGNGRGGRAARAARAARRCWQQRRPLPPCARAPPHLQPWRAAASGHWRVAARKRTCYARTCPAGRTDSCTLRSAPLPAHPLLSTGLRGVSLAWQWSGLGGAAELCFWHGGCRPGERAHAGSMQPRATPKRLRARESGSRTHPARASGAPRLTPRSFAALSPCQPPSLPRASAWPQLSELSGWVQCSVQGRRPTAGLPRGHAAAGTSHHRQAAAATSQAIRIPHPPPPAFPPSDWPGRKAKIATWIGAMWVTGLGLPVFAIWWQQSKLKA
jgi:hypothetical protein